MYSGLLPFFDKFLKQKTHQNILINLILNFEFGDVTIVAYGEQIKARKYLMRFAATIFLIHF